MSRALRRNPQICFSQPKEPHYFLLAPINIPASRFRRLYLRAYYPHLAEQHRVIIDGSVTYLYAPESLKRILIVDPDARFVVMIRNPVDLAYSLHARLLYTMDENVKDFEHAWRLQKSRRLGKNIPRHCRDPHILQYRLAASLGAQLEKLFEIAGRERCHVIVFDDFVNDPVEVYKELLNFIEIEYDGQTRIKMKNSNRTYKNPHLQRIVMSPPRSVVDLIVRWRLNGNSPFSIARKARLWLKRQNTIEIERGPLNESFRIELSEEFSSDVHKLSTLLDRSFENWS